MNFCYFINTVIKFLFSRKAFFFVLLLTFTLKSIYPDVIKAKKYFEFHEYDKCLEEIQKLLNKNKFDIEAHRLYQDIMMERDQYPIIVKKYKEKIDQYPNDYRINFLYGRLLLRNPLTIDSAEKYFNISKKLNPDFPWNYQALADILIKKDDVTKAKDLLEECVRRFPDFEISYLNLTFCYMNLYGPQQCIERLKKITKNIRLGLEMNLTLARLHIQIGEKEDAEILIKKLINDYKDDYRYHKILYNWAECASSSKLREKLLVQYWNDYPNSRLIVSVYRKLYEINKSKSIKKELKFIREALDYKTKIKRLKSIAYENLIELNKHKGIEALEQIGYEIIDSDLSNPNVLNKLGELMLDGGKVELAILLFEKSVNSCKWDNLKNNVVFGSIIRPEEKDDIISLHINNSYYYLAKSYFLKGEFNTALDYFKRIKNVDGPFLEDVSIYIGKCYINLGDKNKGRRIILNLYRNTGSKKALNILEDTFKQKYENLSNFSEKTFSSDSAYDNLKHIRYFDNYKNKLVVLGLYRTGCDACLKLLDVMVKLENQPKFKRDVVFINLFYKNEPELALSSIKVDQDLYRTILLELDIEGVGFRDNENYLDDLAYRILFFMKEK